jgi:hypothetical protein
MAPLNDKVLFEFILWSKSMTFLLTRYLLPKLNTFAALSTTLIFSLVSALVSAQDYQAPRNSMDQPDISGFWQVLNSAAYNVEPHTASTGVAAGVGVITQPDDGMIPYTPAALAQRNQNFANRLTDDPLRHCYKPGIPRLNYLPFPFQIVQTENQVIMIYEYIHNVRTIALNRDEHLDGVEFWNGDSYAHYEGNSLVVNVGGFIPDTWLDEAGNHHSGQLQVTERYTPISPGHMRYDVSLKDPETYTQPWSMSMVLYRHIEEGFRILEYECHAYAEDDAAANN